MRYSQDKRLAAPEHRIGGSAALSCHLCVGTCLARNAVTQLREHANQIGTVAVAGYFQAASTSSREKCSRIIFGRSWSLSKWQATASLTFVRNSSQSSACVNML